MGRRFVVHGVVQGVGFRWFVAKHAGRLGLTGFVRNRPDGTVEVIASGDPPRLADLERELGRGPSGARVERVETSEVPHEPHLPNTFEIK